MPTPTPTPSPAPTPTPTPTPSASANGGNPATAEVEIFGKIILPAGAPKDGKLVVYVAQDDCMKNDAQVLGHIPAATTTGSFAIEVFPKWGTDVTICGALEDASGSATFSGKAVSKEAGGVFHAEKLGEVTFNNVEITLKKGPAHKFPREAN